MSILYEKIYIEKNILIYELVLEDFLVDCYLLFFLKVTQVDVAFSIQAVYSSTEKEKLDNSVFYQWHTFLKF